MLLFIINSIILSVQSEAVVGRKAAKEFYEHDPTGVIMAIIAMTVVFISLFLLYILLITAAGIINGKFKLKRNVSNTNKSEEIKSAQPVSGEINAAIGMALYLYKSRLHDIESFKLTINRVSRIYSPWSSKIYSLRKTPQRIIRK